MQKIIFGLFLALATHATAISQTRSFP